MATGFFYNGTTSTIETTGSFNVVSYGITGSLLGTSSWAVSASWAPGGGAAFPFTGSAGILGNMIVTGSVRGNITKIDTSAVPADIYPTQSNFFQLTDNPGGPLPIDIKTYGEGQSLVLLLDYTAAGAATWTFNGSTIPIYFPNGTNFTGSGTSTFDVVSLLGMDGKYFAVATQNLIQV